MSSKETRIRTHSRVSFLMQRAYKMADDKEECLGKLRRIPSLLRWFSQSQHGAMSAYFKELDASPGDSKFYVAVNGYKDRIDRYVFTDPSAVEAYLFETFRELTVKEVLEG